MQEKNLYYQTQLHVHLLTAKVVSQDFFYHVQHHFFKERNTLFCMKQGLLTYNISDWLKRNFFFFVLKVGLPSEIFITCIPSINHSFLSDDNSVMNFSFYIFFSTSFTGKYLMFFFSFFRLPYSKPLNSKTYA